jgi:mercuric ion binding protein
MALIKIKILILLFLFGLNTLVLAEVQEVTLRVDGLACPFCAYGLEKKIKKLEGFESLDIKINQGKVIVAWRKDKPLDIESIDNAVDNAGFTLRGVKGNFIGRVVKEDGKIFLLLDGPVKQRFYLYEASAIKEKTKLNHKIEASNKAFSDTMRNRLERLTSKAVQVRINGPVHAHQGKKQPMALEIEKLSVREVFEGVLIKENGRMFLDVDESSKLRLTLYETDKLKLTDKKMHKLEGTDKAFTEETRKKLERYLSMKIKVTIIGELHSHQAKSLFSAVAIEELKVVQQVEPAKSKKVRNENEEK